MSPATSPLSVETALAPVAAQERIETLDILRGFAVFGIILADVDILFKISPGTDHVLHELHSVFVVDERWQPMRLASVPLAAGVASAK